jgi:hypothetical protein
MTDKERELMIQIRQQQVGVNGMFLFGAEFKAWACKTYDIDEARLTQLMREVI